MSTELLTHYHAIEKTSLHMVEAAMQGDWDRLIRLEGACAILIAQLRHASKGSTLSKEERKLKGQIMQRILMNDLKIRHLVEPDLDKLDEMLGTARKELLH